MSSSITGRLHFMDAMRAILMMLGVVLHSAQVFNPKQTWLIYSANNHSVMTFLVEIIHVFRMPAFFVVSGFFCYLTLHKYQPQAFLSIRLKRILIPFFFTALTLNTLKVVLLHVSGWEIFDLWSYISTGGYVSHLWFLTNLVVYFCIAYVLARYLSAPMKCIANLVTPIFNSVTMLVIIIILPVLTLAVLALGSAGVPIYIDIAGLVSVYKVLIYSPYFIFGALLALDKSYLERFSTLPPLVLIPLIALCVYLQSMIASTDALLDVLAFEYLNSLIAWLSIGVCFYVFYRFFNKKSALFLFLSEASYTVYLFHHVCVVGLALILIHFHVPAILGLVIMLCVIYAFTLLLHGKVIRHNKALSYMFNGK